VLVPAPTRVITSNYVIYSNSLNRVRVSVSCPVYVSLFVLHRQNQPIDAYKFLIKKFILSCEIKINL